MRNLLGRLHARPAADLDRIAAFWRVPLGGSDRHARVGALYRVMIDPVAGRDVWERLAADEAAVIRSLIDAAAEQAPTLAELATELGVSVDEARDAALRLYRVGLLAREGDNEELPIGEAPRLFLPRELSLLFRRILDEIDLGDRSRTPLHVLIAWLDDGEIDEAAETWGVTIVPGVRRRDDIGRRLLRQIGDPARVAKVALGLGPDARRVWEAVTAAANRGPLALAEAVAPIAGGDDPRAAARVRHALGRLERSLLVWHTYLADGSRALFLPAEIRDPRPAPATPLPPLLPLLPIAVKEPPARPLEAVPWDLLTFLRDVTTSPWPAESEPGRGRLRALNRRLWNAGKELPPPGYVAFLAALATGEGLIGATGEPPTIRPTAAVRRWRDRTFAEQAASLRTRWLDDLEWTEAEGQDEVELWGVEWPRARRRLLALLVEPTVGIATDRWYALELLAQRLAAREPALLGQRFTAATARLSGESGAGAGEEEARAAATAQAIAIELGTALAWFGFVDVAESAGEGQGVRLTAAGATLAHGRELPETPASGEAVSVAADGSIQLRRPSPARVWALSAFADPVALRPAPRYALSADSLRRALEAGFDATQVVAFLERQGGGPLPTALADLFATWQRTVRRVRVRSALLLTPDDGEDVAALVALAVERGWETRGVADGVVALVLPGDDAEEAIAALREAGFSPVKGGAAGGRRRWPAR